VRKRKFRIRNRGIDLSVGAVMALAAAILPLYLGYGWPVAVLMAMLVGVLCGVLNGTLVAVVGVQPIVATLALLVGGRGLALVLADGQAKQILDPGLIGFGSDRVLGIPKTVILAACWCCSSASSCGAPPSAGSCWRWVATRGPAGSPACR
jgi:ribose transport system permease protein